MRFYLGTHQPHWLGTAGIPLFVSHRRLKDRKSFPRAAAPWALDSGGFTELNMHGKWTVTAEEYTEAALRYRDQIGNLDFASPQDWMCEPFVINKTGLSVVEHQQRTIENFLELTSLSDINFIPVLQGWAEDDYWDCIKMYEDAGVDLRTYPTVGIGSVCRRQHTEEIAEILTNISSYGIRLHGFGVKQAGLEAVHDLIASADSMAWSFGARYEPPLPGHGVRHKNCANCISFAIRWRHRILTKIGGDEWSLSSCTWEQ